MSQVEPQATIEDLYRVPGKAELIAGRIMRFPPDGMLPNQVAGRITLKLDDYADSVGVG